MSQLLEEILSKENMTQAYRKVKANKGASGIDGIGIEEIDEYQFSGPYVQFHGDKGQDKYEQIGDAIPPLLASALAKQFIKCLPSHI